MPDRYRQFLEFTGLYEMIPPLFVAFMGEFELTPEEALALAGRLTVEFGTGSAAARAQEQDQNLLRVERKVEWLEERLLECQEERER